VSAPVAPAPNEPAERNDPGRRANKDALALNQLPFLDDQGHFRPIGDIEADVIRLAIAHYRGQMSEVARRLQIGRSTLYRKLELLDLAPPDTDREGNSVAAE
jgi:DNA-binding NtrC family response regulator